MSFFSSHNKNTNKNVPSEILAHVRLMSDPLSPEHVDAPIAEKKSLPIDQKKPLRSVSPFLADEAVVLKNDESRPFIPKKSPETRVPLGKLQNMPAQEITQNPGNKRKKMVVILLGVGGVVVLAGLGIAWYFLRKPATPVAVLENKDATVELSTTMKPQEVLPLPYAQNTPNYLSIDTETVTSQDIFAAIDGAGEKILKANEGGPVEFILTDKNNNPLAFSRVAYLANISLDADLLSALDEPFSIFLYQDNGKVYRGIVLTLGKSEEASTMIAKQEATLPNAFRQLLYRGIDIPQRISFKNGSYAGLTVRYANIDTAQNYSMDYALRNKQWYIGTSKNTLRALLDKK